MRRLRDIRIVCQELAIIAGSTKELAEFFDRRRNSKVCDSFDVRRGWAHSVAQYSMVDEVDGISSEC